MVDFDNARRTMVDNQLRTIAVNDHRLLQAVLAVPRENFVPAERRVLSYIDESHPIGNGRSLPPAGPIVKLIALAEVSHTDKVLDVSCGNGYAAAVLSHMAAEVYALEADADLAKQAGENLAAIECANTHVITGPLADGIPADAPFDVILIEGAVASVPEALLLQLKDGGRLVALIQGVSTATAHVYVRSGREFSPRAEFNAVLPRLDWTPQTEEFVF